MKTNGAYGSRSQSRYQSDRGDTIRGGRSLDTPDRRIDMYGYHYTSSSRRHHHSYHCYNPYRRGEYLLYEFNKVKPPIFGGEMKKEEDAKVWLLGMNKFFRFHSYSENTKSKIAIFSIKGKAYIWWEDMKNVKGIREDELTWDEFERLFKNKYLLVRYYDDKDKEFYELQVGSMTNDEYTSRFLELLRYVPYLKEEKTKIQRFISGFPTTYRDQIKFDEAR